MLMVLPGMTDDIADASSTGSTPTTRPATRAPRASTTAAFNPPMSPRTPRPPTIEELLLVKGVTPELLYGYDAVKMGYSSSDSVSGGHLRRRHRRLDGPRLGRLPDALERRIDPQAADGTPKINVNQEDMATLYTQLTAVLDPTWAQYIVAYRQGGGTADSSGNLDTTAFRRQGPQHDRQPAGPDRRHGRPSRPAGTPRLRRTTPRESVYHRQLGDERRTCLNSSTIAPRWPGTSIPGRININQAPRVVLMCHSRHDPGYCHQIIAQSPARSGLACGPDRPDLCPAWPLIEGIMPLATMKPMLPYINGRGERLPGPNNRPFRQRKSRFPAGSHT